MSAQEPATPQLPCSDCGKMHRTFKTVAKCRWPSAHWVTGNGPWASFSACGSGRYDSALTIMLFKTRAEADQAKAIIDSSACGGRCTKRHWVTRLKEAGAQS